MAWRAALLPVIWLAAACGSPQPAPERSATPTRIVSLDYCADQFVLKFADPSDILAVSPDAGKDFSFMREAAADVARVRPSAEDVLLLKPDLVVRAYGGGPGATALFERVGIPVLEVGWSPDLEAVRTNTLRVPKGLGQADRGVEVVEDFDARIAEINSAETATALYATPGGATTGPGGLIGEILEQANLDNFIETPGWQTLPLERLAYEGPDVFVFADFEGGAGPWSAARHSVFRNRMDAAEVREIEGAWTACGGWFVIEAIETLTETWAP